MMETVGAKPTEKYTDYGGRTLIEYTNPADVDFVVNTVEIYLISGDNHTITAGAFSGSNPFTSQDSVNLGTVTGTNSYHSYTGLSIDFKSGERIGAYDNAQLGLAQTPSNAGRNYVGNAFGAGAVTFNNTYPCCIYGSGEIAAVGSKAFMHYYKNLMAGGVGKRC